MTSGPSRSFSYGAESPLRALLLAYPVLVLGDELVAMACIPARFVALHVVIAALGVYGFVWLLRVCRSMRARPHVLDDGTLRLYRGALGSAVVALDDIVTAAPVDDDELARLDARPFRLDVGGERVLLTLRVPVRCSGPVRGLRSREARALLVSADDPRALCAALRAGSGAGSPGGVAQAPS